MPEIDNNIINKYAQTYNTTTLLSSVIVTPTYMADFYTIADTTFVDIWQPDATLNPYFNWQIIIPATLDTFG